MVPWVPVGPALAARTVRLRGLVSGAEGKAGPETWAQTLGRALTASGVLSQIRSGKSTDVTSHTIQGPARRHSAFQI